MNINVLEALAKHRCLPIGKQKVYQWSASLLESICGDEGQNQGNDLHYLSVLLVTVIVDWNIISGINFPNF